MSKLHDLPATRRHKNMLLDLYGALLTQKQREIYAMHHDDDCSLAEIAAAIGITPQAVADSLKRTDAKLNSCEAKLNLMLKFQMYQDAAMAIEKELDALGKLPGTSAHVTAIRDSMKLLSM